MIQLNASTTRQIEEQTGDVVLSDTIQIDDMLLFDGKINPVKVEKIDNDHHRILINGTWHFSLGVGVRIRRTT